MIVHLSSYILADIKYGIWITVFLNIIKINSQLIYKFW